MTIHEQIEYLVSIGIPREYLVMLSCRKIMDLFNKEYPKK